MRGLVPYRLLAVLSVAMAANGSFAQGTGKVRMKIDPEASFEYVVDHRFRMRQLEVELSTGAHHFSIWAPQRAIVDTQVVVEDGRTKELVLRLPFAKDYLVYQRDLRRYEGQRRAYRLAPVLVTGATAIYTAACFLQLKKAHDQLEEDQAAYEAGTAPHQITVLKTVDIPAHKEDFRKARTRFLIASGATLACAGATAYLFHRSAKVKRPEYRDAEKIRFDGLSWMPGPSGGTWQGGLTWNFAR